MESHPSLFREALPGEWTEGAREAWIKHVASERASCRMYTAVYITCGVCKSEIKPIVGCDCSMEKFVVKHMQRHRPVNFAFVESIIADHAARSPEIWTQMTPDKRKALSSRMYRVAWQTAELYFSKDIVENKRVR